mmetsp:Transcript_7797/g.22284  ORF Transcript_7797/g.22284 Transcript_7797/m.22284 type:complete len:214 (+) Transcript_7797:1373-2014(+)
MVPPPEEVAHQHLGQEQMGTKTWLVQFQRQRDCQQQRLQGDEYSKHLFHLGEHLHVEVPRKRSAWRKSVWACTVLTVRVLQPVRSDLRVTKVTKATQPEHGFEEHARCSGQRTPHQRDLGQKGEKSPRPREACDAGFPPQGRDLEQRPGEQAGRPRREVSGRCCPDAREALGSPQGAQKRQEDARLLQAEALAEGQHKETREPPKGLGPRRFE